MKEYSSSVGRKRYFGSGCEIWLWAFGYMVDVAMGVGGESQVD